MNVPYQIPGRAPDEDRSQNVSTYWRERFTEEPYYTEGDRYEDYEGAYLAGHEARIRDNARAYDQVEAEFASRLGSQARNVVPKLEQGATRGQTRLGKRSRFRDWRRYPQALKQQRHRHGDVVASHDLQCISRVPVAGYAHCAVRH